MKKQPALIAAVAIAAVLGVIVLIFAASRGGGGTPQREINSVSVQKDGNTLTVSRDGTVSYKTSEGIFEDFWDSDKTDTFFAYINGKYTGSGELVTGGGNYISINGGAASYILGEDELIDQVEEETGGGGTGGTGGSGGSGGFPTPAGATPTPSSPGQGGGGGTGGSSECLYWRLSYCVRPRTPIPTHSATPVPAEIREPDCGANTQTGKTVIGNDLCISTPSPTPTP